MAHLTTDLRPCCKNCIYLGYYDDRQASWYYCSYLGDSYNSLASKYVDHVEATLFEKREGDLIPRVYEVFAPDFCTHSFDLIKLKSAVEYKFDGVLKDALIHVLNHYNNI